MARRERWGRRERGERRVRRVRRVRMAGRERRRGTQGCRDAGTQENTSGAHLILYSSKKIVGGSLLGSGSY